MGDSGSLVLGLFVYLSACPSYENVIYSELLVDRYFAGFILALFSAILFDFVRVVIMRVSKKKTPFMPDRTHLHHIYTDTGMSHLIATVIIIVSNIIVLAIWAVTAYFEINVYVQLVIVVLSGIMAFWMPYYLLDYLRRQKPERYQKHLLFWSRRSELMEPLCAFVCRVIDGRKQNTKQVKE